MDRAQFEHVIAAAANVVGEDELVVIGSQAILGSHPDAPSALLRSMEADVYPKANPDKADEIDGSLGDGSRFHEAYGFYAHGVGPETATPPAGWEERLVVVESHLDLRPNVSRRPTASSLTTWCSRSAWRAGTETGTSRETRLLARSSAESSFSSAWTPCR